MKAFPRRGLLLVLLAQMSCTTIKGPHFEDQFPLRSETVGQLNGCYSYQGDDVYCESCAPVDLFSKRVLGYFGKRLVKGTLPRDSARVVQLEVVSSKYVLLTAFSNGELVEQRRFRGKVGPGGYYGVRGYHSIRGGPFPVVWEPVWGDAQLGLTEAGNLTVDEAGGIFGFVFLLPLMAAAAQQSYEFQRIEGMCPPETEERMSGLGMIECPGD